MKDSIQYYLFQSVLERIWAKRNNETLVKVDSCPEDQEHIIIVKWDDMELRLSFLEDRLRIRAYVKRRRDPRSCETEYSDPRLGGRIDLFLAEYL